jgi:hypothetical protein
MVVGAFCSFSFIVCMGNRSFRVSLGRTVALSNGAWDCMGRNVRVYRGVPGNRTLVVDKKKTVKWKKALPSIIAVLLSSPIIFISLTAFHTVSRTSLIYILRIDHEVPPVLADTLPLRIAFHRFPHICHSRQRPPYSPIPSSPTHQTHPHPFLPASTRCSNP